ncbi:MAG: NgoMIV family type II restriction endonuclease [Propionibacteriaceae bacterium]|nr:NgoMIV family type II restriction endonuclease [Propionibacteriaceae bacterium]
MTALISSARAVFHQQLVDDTTLSLSPEGVASNADSSQKTSKHIALSIANDIGAQVVSKKLDGQRAGHLFEQAVREFLAATFPALGSISSRKVADRECWRFACRIADRPV